MFKKITLVRNLEVWQCSSSCRRSLIQRWINAFTSFRSSVFSEAPDAECWFWHPVSYLYAWCIRSPTGITKMVFQDLVNLMSVWLTRLDANSRCLCVKDSVVYILPEFPVRTREDIETWTVLNYDYVWTTSRFYQIFSNITSWKVRWVTTWENSRRDHTVNKGESPSKGPMKVGMCAQAYHLTIIEYINHAIIPVQNPPSRARVRESTS